MAKNKITRFGDSGHQLVDEDGKTRIIKQFKPGPQAKKKVNDVNVQVYRGDLNFHPRPLTYSLF